MSILVVIKSMAEKGKIGNSNKEGNGIIRYICELINNKGKDESDSKKGKD